MAGGAGGFGQSPDAAGPTEGTVPGAKKEAEGKAKEGVEASDEAKDAVGGQDKAKDGGGKPGGDKGGLSSMMGGKGGALGKAGGVLGALGAGGTSEAAEGKEGSPGGAAASAAGKKVAKAAALPAANAAAQVGFAMMVLNWLKFMFQAALAFAANLWSMILGMIVAAFKAVVGFFVSAGAAVASFVGGVISATAAAIGTAITAVLTVALVVGAVIGVVDASELGKYDGAAFRCAEQVLNVEKKAEGETGDASAQTEANAKTIYSVFSAWGMPDENIAGIIGNWSAESGIDPTGVEGIYDEPNTMGPKKKAAEAEGFKGYTNGLGATMDVRGLGLGQWTNGRGQALLDYSKAIGKDWYTLETQLGFMVSDAEGENAKVVKGMMAEGKGSPEEAAVYFHDEWERSADTSMDVRKTAASTWFAKMGGWDKNYSLANSILEQAGTSLDGAKKDSVSKAMDECIGTRLNVDNSTMAKALATYAWPHYDDAAGNDGTDLYKWLHEEIFPGTPYFASCDNSVSTAVRWAGGDDTYPQQSVLEQIQYLMTSDKWQKVSDWDGDISKLSPGDVFIRKDSMVQGGSGVSHTLMWLGEDVVKEVWGEGNYMEGGNLGEGSLNDHSPGINVYRDDLSTYQVYRLKKPEADSKYSSITPPGSIKPGEGDKNKLTTPAPG